MFDIVHNIGHIYCSSRFSGKRNIPEDDAELLADVFTGYILSALDCRAMFSEKLVKQIASHPIRFTNPTFFVTTEQRLFALNFGRLCYKSKMDVFSEMFNYSDILSRINLTNRVYRTGTGKALNTDYWYYWLRINDESKAILYFDPYMNVCNNEGSIIGKVVFMLHDMSDL